GECLAVVTSDDDRQLRAELAEEQVAAKPGLHISVLSRRRYSSPRGDALPVQSIGLRTLTLPSTIFMRVSSRSIPSRSFTDHYYPLNPTPPLPGRNGKDSRGAANGAGLQQRQPRPASRCEADELCLNDPGSVVPGTGRRRAHLPPKPLERRPGVESQPGAGV